MGFQMFQIADDVDAYYQGIQRGQLASHFDYTQIPAPVARYKENHMRWLRRLAVNRERSETAELDVILFYGFSNAFQYEASRKYNNQ